MIIRKDGRHHVVFLLGDTAYLMPAFWYWWNDSMWDMGAVIDRMPSLRDQPMEESDDGSNHHTES